MCAPLNTPVPPPIAAYYNGSAVAVPLAWNALHLLYRKDVLGGLNATVPATWPELVALARYLHGRDLNSDGQPGAGVCVLQEPGEGSLWRAAQGRVGNGRTAAGRRPTLYVGVATSKRRRWAGRIAWGAGHDSSGHLPPRYCTSTHIASCRPRCIIMCGLTSLYDLGPALPARPCTCMHACMRLPGASWHAYKCHVSCLRLAPHARTHAGCSLHGALLVGIWASYAQSQGTQQGLQFDPLTMQPSLDSDAFLEALRVVGSLAPFGAAPGAAGSGCTPVHPAFVAGRCALTFATTLGVLGAVGQLAAPAPDAGGAYAPRVLPGTLAGRLGVARLPGSAVVLDSRSGRLVACGPAPSGHCPHARPEEAVWYAPTLAEALQLPYRPGSVAPEPPYPHPPLLVNYAPLIGSSSLVGLVSSSVPPYRQALALQLLAQLAGGSNSLLGDGLFADPRAPSGMTRAEYLQSGASLLEAAGYGLQDVGPLVESGRGALEHRNAVPALRIPGALRFR